MRVGGACVASLYIGGRVCTCYYWGGVSAVSKGSYSSRPYVRIQRACEALRVSA